MGLSITRGIVVLGVAAAGVALGVAGCDMMAPSAAGAASRPAEAAAEKSGAELWAQTCSHCHNLRSPSSFGPAQWEVAVYDMRVRANLTGEEQRKILEFLKAASQ